MYAKDKVLRGGETLALYEKGIDEWNVWAQQHKDWNVDFEATTFNAVKTDFSGFVFPGTTNFNAARFSGEVDFSNAKFSGEAFFNDAKFSGEAIFSRATFSGATYFNMSEFLEVSHFGSATFSGGAYFSETRFSKDAHFGDAKFSGEAVFRGAEFSWMSRFEGAEFSEMAYFSEARFTEVASFAAARFSGEASFAAARFSGEVVFSEARFSEWADFKETTFSGEADFSFATFTGDSSFANAKFSEVANFQGSRFEDGDHSPRFTGSLFEAPIYFDDCCFARVPDFQFSLMHSGIKLSGINVTYQVEGKKWKGKAVDGKDSARYRRFKELAISAKDRERERMFFAYELKAKRFYECTGLQLIPNFLYEWLSDFGQSLVRPLWALLVTWILFGSIYYVVSFFLFEQIPSKASALIYSAFQIIPFSGRAGETQSKANQDLFTGSDGYIFPDVMYVVTALESILGLACLFLICLALRARFRI